MNVSHICCSHVAKRHCSLFRRFYRGCIFFASVFFLINTQQAFAQPDAEAFSILKADYQRITTFAVFEAAGKTTAFSPGKKNLNSLLREAQRADKRHDGTLLIGLVSANLNLIKQNISDVAVQQLARLLFKYHASGMVDVLLEYAQEHGDQYTQARLRFEQARYLSAQQEWAGAYALLQSMDISNTLPHDMVDEAFIILGATLQNQKKHREAVGYFFRVKPESEHYRVAQLNTAIAYIRQDWWTDAHIAIRNALKVRAPRNDELTNRLYTVLGFSQLQHGFYRDARESFRHVHLKSQYANRALLGLGVAALHQEDFIGALNAFNHLKKKNENDISVSESYLLSSFTLMQLKQDRTASASYTEAITFYEQRSAAYTALTKAIAAPEHMTRDQQGFLSEEIKGHPTIQALHIQRLHLQRLQSYGLSADTGKAIDALAIRIEQAYIEQIRDLLTEKQFVIDSYLSQSRFGLARLFDTQ